MGVTTTKPVMSLAEMRTAGKQIARQAGGSTVQAFFEAKKDTLAAVLPKHMTPDRMLRIAMGALRTTPKLMDCTTESLFGAVVAVSQLGLEPNTPQGHAYLLPFEKRAKGQDGQWYTERTDVQVIIGYKGLIDLARRSGQIVSISARTRCRNDEWRMVLGTADEIHHIPAEGDRGDIVGFYAVAKLKDGGVQFEYMSEADVNKVKAQSKAAKSGPWVSHFEEMAKKTVVRRLCKMLPMSIELARATAMDEMAEGGRDQQFNTVLDAEWSPVDDMTADDDAAGSDQQKAATFAIKGDKGHIEYPSIEAWEAEWTKIAGSLNPAQLQRAREMNGALMAEYAADHREAVMRVQAALDAKTKGDAA
jgi:recombination protein RecT